MTTPRTQRQTDSIEFHIREAQKAANMAAAYLADADSVGKGPVAEEERALGYYRATMALAAARVADTHARLLELKLSVGDPAL